ncbi:TetR family transcriptional regulator [Kitasatospora sp. NPDC096077]|uniref:TetR/AcrR family transcriptional regulator n=1 Tax=Kitasatospora sp. NPDC096077 TaxID=3155544 RepID=UPI0033305167
MSLRDRKRARTRQALIDAGAELFERQGYDGTTVADIAAAAEIGTRTFFSYFASKEELLFPDADERIRAAEEAIASRGPDDGPADVLLRALRTSARDTDLLSPIAARRIELIRTVPAVRGRALQIQLDAQRVIADRLAEAFPDRLDPVTAAALTGAFIGAVTGALQVLLAGPGTDAQAVRTALQTATDVALAPWQHHTSRNGA